MYTERDAKRMQDWQTIFEQLRDVLSLYRQRLAYDAQANKPTWEPMLESLASTARAQSKLWEPLNDSPRFVTAMLPSETNEKRTWAENELRRVLDHVSPNVAIELVQKIARGQ